MGTTQCPERANEVASLLKQADKLVKEENLAAALEVIVKAQSCDPRNLYAMAYEERVKALLNVQMEEEKRSPAATPKPAQSTPALSAPAQISAAKTPPPLQYLSNLAVIEAQHSAAPAAEKKHTPNASEELKRKQEERLPAVEEKIEVFLTRAVSFFEKKEYSRSLDEITRAYLIDPANEKIFSLEEKVREAIEIQRRTLAAAQQEKVQQLTKKAEEEKLKTEGRRAAVEQQIASFLSQAASYSEKKEYNRALDEIARAYLLDPANEKIQSAEKNIRHVIEVQQDALGAAQHNTAQVPDKKEDEEKLKQEERQRIAIEQKITAFLVRAAAYCEKKEYNRALDEIARAYLFDPVNEKIRRLEEKIRSAQEEARRVGEEMQKNAAVEKRNYGEAVEMQVCHAQPNKSETVNDEKYGRKREHNGDVRRYLQRVNELFASNRLEEALSELAFVIIIDPLNADVLKLEQKIIEKQEQRQQQQLELYQKQLEERQKRRQAIVAAIQMLAREHKNSDALRTIAQSIVLDPINEELQEYEKQMLATQTVFLASCDES